MDSVKKNIELSKEHKDLRAELEKALKKVSEKLIAEEKAAGGYLIVSDKDGNIKKVPARDL
jgi:hypothetical protein